MTRIEPRREMNVSKGRVLVTDDASSKAKAVLEAAGFTVKQVPTPRPEALAAELDGMDGIIVRSATKLTAAVLEQASLKIIGRAGAGLDNIDMNAAKRLGITVVNSPFAHAVSVAEHTMAMLLAITKCIPAADKSMKEGKWLKKLYENNEVRGKALGIIGSGHVGVEVAKRALAFGMRVVSFDVVKTCVEEATRVGCEAVPSIDDMIRQVDYLTLHVPLNEHTRHLINKERLAAMKPSAIIINTSRGEVIDQAALVEALAAKRIKGAALDVFATEPVDPADPILRLDNVVLTPHIASSTAENQEAAAVIVAEEIARALAGGTSGS